jgi:hypothetical protein
MIHPRASTVPRPVWLLFLAYTLASFAHFVHNAEFIAFYPGMPVWITRETLYQAWWVVAGVGVLGLGLCSEHTWLANLTVWAEAISGAALAIVAVVWAWAQRPARRKRPRS